MVATRMNRWDDGWVTDSALPYVAGLVLAVWWIAGETWLQRRTGQTWWTIHELGWGVFSAGLAVVIAIAGHPLPALAAGSIAIWQLRSARRTWLSREETERYRPQRTGVRGWLFIGGAAAVWTLLEHAGLSYVSAGLVAGLTSAAVFLPWRRSEGSPTGNDTVISPVDRFEREPQQGRGFEVTISGRPAKLAARMFDRGTRPPGGARDDERRR